MESNSSSCEEKALASFSLTWKFELLENSAEFVHRTGGHVFELQELLLPHANNSQ